MTARAALTWLQTPQLPLRRVRPMPSMSVHFWAGCILVLLVVTAGTFAPYLSSYSPTQLDASAIELPPSWDHPFGTDSFGRDLLSRVLYGARIDLLMACSAVCIGACPGVLLGLLAGRRGGWLEKVITRLMDAWLALPPMLVAIVLIARAGPSLSSTVLALGISGVPGFYRLVRRETQKLNNALFIEAAESIGVKERWILLRHILPNLSSPLVVMFTIRLGTQLLAIGGLSFIGLGAQPPQPEWGALLSSGRETLETAWWLATFPGIALTMTVVGFNLLGDGLRDYLARR